MRLIEQYNTPTGYFDFPFAYVFDGTNLPDIAAVDPEVPNQIVNLSKTLQGDSDFVLRRIAGVTTCVNQTTLDPTLIGKFDFKNASGSYAMQNGGSSGVKAFPNWVVLPEKFYGRNTQIVFDLYNTVPSATTCTRGGLGPIPTAYIAFFGVKRFQGCRSQEVRPFKPVKYTYSYPLTINVSGISDPIRQSQPIDNYDFELQRIAITEGRDGNALVTDDFSVTLYDSNMNQTSDLPLLQSFINSASHAFDVYQPIWPVPTLVYPAGSAITFDVTSLICTDCDECPSLTLPQTYNVALEGIWRIPTKC